MRATQKIVTNHPTAAVFDYSTSNKLRTVFFNFVEQFYLPDLKEVEPDWAKLFIAVVVNHDATIDQIDRILDDALNRMGRPPLSLVKHVRRMRRETLQT